MQTLFDYILSLLFNMSKEFTISETRRVLVKKNKGEYCITIEEIGNVNKSLEFSGRRFAQLTALEFIIDQSVSSLPDNQDVAFKAHLGGGYFVSVTSGFNCVDLREFYFNKAKGYPCPTKHGIALRLVEWAKIKELFQEIKLQFPALAKIESCSVRADHFTLDGYLSCTECQFFMHQEKMFSQSKGEHAAGAASSYF